MRPPLGLYVEHHEPEHGQLGIRVRQSDGRRSRPASADAGVVRHQCNAALRASPVARARRAPGHTVGLGPAAPAHAAKYVPVRANGLPLAENTRHSSAPPEARRTVRVEHSFARGSVDGGQRDAQWRQIVYAADRSPGHLRFNVQGVLRWACGQRLRCGWMWRVQHA